MTIKPMQGDCLDLMQQISGWIERPDDEIDADLGNASPLE